MLKRILPLLLAGCLLLALAACGNDQKPASSAAASPSAEPAAAATPTPTPVPEAKAAKVRANGGLNLRKEPSTDSEVLLLTEDGDLLPLLMDKATDGWYQVQYRGMTGYVSADYVEVVAITLENYNLLKGAVAEATPEPEQPSEPTPTPAPTPRASTNPEDQGVLTPPVDQQSSSSESGFSSEDGE